MKLPKDDLYVCMYQFNSELRLLPVLVIDKPFASISTFYIVFWVRTASLKLTCNKIHITVI